MTNGLRRGLAELAELAPDYADAGAAMAVARGRSRRRRIAASVAAILVVTLGIGVGTQRVRDAGLRPQPAIGTGTPVLTLPAVVTPPAHDVPPLPAGGPVGRAVLAYRLCARPCPTYLLMADGRQYRLDVPTVPNPAFLPVSLSPQGRYLAIDESGGQTEIRDLLGTTVHRVSVDAVTGWSRNDRYALGDDALLDLRTWRMSPVNRPPDLTYVAGVSDDGRIVETVNENDPTVLGLATLSYPGTFNMIEATDLLGPDEIVAEDFTAGQSGGGSAGKDWNEVAFGPGDRMAVVVYSSRFRYTEDLSFQSPRRAILLGEARTGRLWQRVDLPAHAGAPFYLGDQPVFALQASRSAPIRLERVTAGGSIVSICELPPTADYIVAGMRGAVPGPADPRGIEPGW